MLRRAGASSGSRSRKLAGQHQAQSSLQRRVSLQRRAQNPRRRHTLANTALNFFRESFFDQRPGSSYRASHDHSFRTKADNQIGNTDPEVTGRLSEGGLGFLFSRQGTIDKNSEIRGAVPNT